MASSFDEEMLWDFDNPACETERQEDDLCDQQAFTDVDCESGTNYSFKQRRGIAIQFTREDRRISPGLDSGHFSGTQDLSNGGAGTNQSDFSLRHPVTGHMISPIRQNNQTSSVSLKTSLPDYSTTPGPQEPQTQNLLSPTNSSLKRSYKDYQLSHMKRGKREDEDVTGTPTKPRVITATPLPKDNAYGNLFNSNEQYGQSRDNLYTTTFSSRNPKQILSPEVTPVPVKFEERQQQPTKCSPEVNQSLQALLMLQNGSLVLEGQGQSETKVRGENNHRDKTHQQIELSEEEEKKRRQQMKNRQYAKESRERKNKKLEALEKDNKKKDVEIEVLRKVLTNVLYKQNGREINWQLQEIKWFIKEANGGQGYFTLECLLPACADILRDLGNSHFGKIIPPPSQPDDVTSATNDRVRINDLPNVREGLQERASSSKPLGINSFTCGLETIGGNAFVKPDQESIVSNDFIMSGQENLVSNVPTFLVQEDMVTKHRDSQALVFTPGSSNGHHSILQAEVTPDTKTGYAQGSSSWQHTSHDGHTGVVCCQHTSHDGHTGVVGCQHTSHDGHTGVVGCQHTSHDGHTGVVGLFGSTITVSSQTRKGSRDFDDVSPWCTQFPDNTNSQGQRTQCSRNSQGQISQDSRNSQGQRIQDSRNSQGQRTVDSNFLYAPTQELEILEPDLEDTLPSEVFNLSSMDLGLFVSEVTDLS